MIQRIKYMATYLVVTMPNKIVPLESIRYVPCTSVKAANYLIMNDEPNLGTNFFFHSCNLLYVAKVLRALHFTLDGLRTYLTTSVLGPKYFSFEGQDPISRDRSDQRVLSSPSIWIL